MTLWLLESQSLATFVLVKSISMLAINVLAAVATIGAAVAGPQGGPAGPPAGGSLGPVPVAA